jgi:hypothetical protein
MPDRHAGSAARGPRLGTATARRRRAVVVWRCYSAAWSACRAARSIVSATTLGMEVSSAWMAVRRVGRQGYCAPHAGTIGHSTSRKLDPSCRNPLTAFRPGDGTAGFARPRVAFKEREQAALVAGTRCTPRCGTCCAVQVSHALTSLRPQRCDDRHAQPMFPWLGWSVRHRLRNW